MLENFYSEEEKSEVVVDENIDDSFPLTEETCTETVEATEEANQDIVVEAEETNLEIVDEVQEIIIEVSSEELPEESVEAEIEECECSTETIEESSENNA